MSELDQFTFEFMNDEALLSCDPKWEKASDLEKLISVVGYPRNAVNPPSEADWLTLQAQLGCHLPPSYKEMVNLFGIGEWGNFLHTLVPGYDLEYVAWRCSGLAEEFSEFSWYPAEGGLLLWGFTDTRTTLCWDRANSGPNQWEIVIVEEGFEAERFAMSVPLFLANATRGKIESYLLPATQPGFFAFHEGRKFDVCLG